MALATLPYPNMDFTPLDILTADELDQIVANIDAINNATINEGAIATNAVSTAKVADGAITTAKVANSAITNAKIDWTTVPTTDISSSFTWASGIGTNKLLVMHERLGFVSISEISVPRTQTPWSTAWQTIGTIASQYRPSASVVFPAIFTDVSDGLPKGYGRLIIRPSGSVEAKANAQINNVQCTSAGTYAI